MDITLSKDAICAIFRDYRHAEYDSFCVRRALDLIEADRMVEVLAASVGMDVDRFLDLVPEQPEKSRLRNVLIHDFLISTAEAEPHAVS
jgi:hypothetical protein